jgi:hypothetical protein
VVKSHNKLINKDKKQFAVSFLNILANNFLPVIRALGAMSKLKFKFPLLFLISPHIIVVLGLGYLAYQNNQPVPEAILNYFRDTRLIILISQLSLVGFLTSFTLINSHIDFGRQDYPVQQLYLAFVFLVSCVVVDFLSCLITLGRVCNIT